MLSRKISDRRTEILDLANRFGMTDIRVFESQARGTASEGSDVDFVVYVRSGRSLLDLLGFEAAVEALLGCPVDVVCPNGDCPRRFTKKFGGSVFRYDRAIPGVSGVDSPKP